MAAAFDYARSKATAERLLARYGGAGAIRRMETSGDPWNPELTPVDYDCTLLIWEYSLRERDNSLISATDERLLISTKGLTITPTNADKIVVEGTAHEIVRIKPGKLKPGGLVLYYEAQVTF